MAGQQLSKRALVRKGWEYTRIYSGGKRLHGEGFTLICLPNGTAMNRLGISVHRKVRGAAKRNRLKRIIRESFRRQRDIYPQDADVVFAVRPDFSCRRPEEVSSAISPLLRRYEQSLGRI